MKSRDHRDQVMSIVEALVVAETIKHGMPLSNSRELEGRVNNYFDMAETIVGARDTRYPHLKDA